MTSPGTIFSMSIIRSVPSTTTRASLAPSSSSRCTAAEARPLARASKARPKVISVMITAAVSK